MKRPTQEEAAKDEQVPSSALQRGESLIAQDAIAIEIPGSQPAKSCRCIRTRREFHKAPGAVK
ncbi:MAG: hypothetical protein AB1756_01630 [Acidobacteriota bacterium]